MLQLLLGDIGQARQRGRFHGGHLGIERKHVEPGPELVQLDVLVDVLLALDNITNAVPISGRTLFIGRSDCIRGCIG